MAMFSSFSNADPGQSGESPALRAIKLNIVIVGAGIGGLTAAIALRQQGHQVDIYEQSAFASEIGAAISVTPNANSVLSRFGVDVENAAAVKLSQTRYFKSSGELLSLQDDEADSHRWQKPWMLTYRAYLHSYLKREALSPSRAGPQARLHTSARVTKIDAQEGVVTLAGGSTIRGDAVIGADGVRSVCRVLTAGTDYNAYRTDTSAFRFMVPRDAILSNPVTRDCLPGFGSLDMYYGPDRKTIIYPANDTLVNIGCLHPAILSDATSDTYSKAASKDNLLDIFREFDPKLLQIFDMCDEDSLKVYPFFDAKTLPSFVSGRLALIGDAAHPFTPHLAQGAAMAIEDAVSLGVMLSAIPERSEVPTRLKLYNEARYSRASTIQQYSRIVGGDGISADDEHVDAMKVLEYIHYGFSHDEYHASTQRLREHRWSQNPSLFWRQPTVFGPMPGPRQNVHGKSIVSSVTHGTGVTAQIIFKTSATLLQNMLPKNGYSFTSKDTVALASLSVQSLDNIPWLGGGGYQLMMFQIHGVKYTKSDGSYTCGRFCPVLFENLADTILSGRDELGWPKLYSEITITQPSAHDRFEANIGWRGTKWANFWLSDLHEESIENSNPQNDEIAGEGLLVRKIAPSGPAEPPGHRLGQHSDVFYPDSHSAQNDVSKTRNDHNANESLKNCNIIPMLTSRKVSKKAGFTISSPKPEELPTIGHIVERLSEVPVFDIVEARFSREKGVRNFSNAVKLSD